MKFFYILCFSVFLSMNSFAQTQTSDVIASGNNLTASSFDVSFTSSTNLTGTGTAIQIMLRTPTADGASISLGSSNPFGLTFQASFDHTDGFTYWFFIVSGLSLDLVTSFPMGSPTLIASFNYSGTPSSIEILNEQSPFPPSCGGGVCTWSQTALLSSGTLVNLVGASNQVILPIELLSFNAKNKQSHIALSWVTASEINNSHFEIERSADGDQFEMIATVDGAGNSSQTLEYSYNDMTPLNGINYYRLVNVDFDETRHFNEIRSVDFVTGDDDSNTISVYPNPVTNSFSVVSQGEIDGQTVRLLDTQGRLVSELPYHDGMIVDMDDMAAGIYRLMIISNTNETVHVQQVLKN